MIVPPTEQQIKSLSHSTVYADYNIEITATFSSLSRLLFKICQGKVPESISEAASQLYEVFESNRTSLQLAMEKCTSQGENQKTKPSSKNPTTLNQAVKNGLPPDVSESVLQTLCFDDLRIIGEFYCLENTSGSVFGSEVDGLFRKLNFIPSYVKSNAPNLTLRLKCTSDENMKKYDYQKGNLVPYRLVPWSVVAYLELKGWNESLDHHIKHS